MLAHTMLPINIKGCLLQLAGTRVHHTGVLAVSNHLGSSFMHSLNLGIFSHFIIWI